MSNPRWQRRPEGSNWGEFGPDDQLGRMNFITPEKVLQGRNEIRDGRSFCLSLPLDYPGGSPLNPRRRPPILRPTLRNGKPNFNCVLAAHGTDSTDVINDDLAVLHLQYSTQWDGLAHVGALFDADDDGTPEPVFYNGFRAGVEIVGPTDPAEAGVPTNAAAQSTSRAGALGIETMAATCVQGRGVMIDLFAHFGRERVFVGYDILMQVLDAGRITIEHGDMVCLHTGFAQLILDMAKLPDPKILQSACAVLNGRDPKLLNWITDSGLAAIAADNAAVEAHPGPPGAPGASTLPLHEHCLFKLGIPLGELWYLTPLAAWLRAAGRSRFLLTAPPLRLTGAIGSPVTPVATV